MAMKTKLVNVAIAAIVGAGLALASMPASAGSHEKGKMKPDKCYGIVKKEMNGCGTKKHSCAGQAKEDGHAIPPTGKL